MRISSQKEKQTFSLIIDISSAQISAAYIIGPTAKGSTHTQMLATSHISFIPQHQLNFEIFNTIMTKALKDALIEIHNYKFKRPDMIHVFLASPWCSTQSKHISTKRSKNMRVTQKFLDDLMTKNRTHFELALKEKYKEVGGNLKIIEQKVMQILLNGYSNESPIGYQAKTIDAFVYLSVMPEYIEELISNVIKEVYPHTKTIFHSHLLPLFIFSRNQSLASSADYLLIDIGGELSEIALISQGILKQSATFPFGYETLVRGLSSLGFGDYEQVRSIIRLYVEGKLSGADHKNLDGPLATQQTIWSRMFSNALSMISQSLSLPTDVYMYADRYTAPWFADAITQESFHQYTSLNKAFHVIFPTLTIFTNYLYLVPGATRDLVLSCEAVYLTSIFNS